jgi:hypothetical protein
MSELDSQIPTAFGRFCFPFRLLLFIDLINLLLMSHDPENNPSGCSVIG